MKTTKELARELGLLRRRTLSASNEASCTKSVQPTGQLFSYLIVIDFESTCWQEGKFRTQEVIEFPAVLLNTRTGEIEAEFHHYVQPQEHPVLSSFCTELTGITQDKVESGIPIGLCLKRFSHWLQKLHKEKGLVCNGSEQDSMSPRAACVTWSDWDLGVCLQYECKRKQVMKPGELNSWIDLRATYRKFYERKPNGLNGALQDLGIEFEGREHSGIADARNTAKLAWRMIRDGCQLKITKSLKTSEPAQSNITGIERHFKVPKTIATSTPKGKGKSVQNKTPKKKSTPSKIPVRVSPIKGGKFTVYVDPTSSQTADSSRTVGGQRKLGLAVQDPNIQSLGPSVEKKGLKRGANTPSKTPVKSFKKPSPVCGRSKSVIPSIQKGFDFKTPSPVSKRRKTVASSLTKSKVSRSLHSVSIAGIVNSQKVKESEVRKTGIRPAQLPNTYQSFKVPSNLKTPNSSAQRPSILQTPSFSTASTLGIVNPSSSMKVTPPLCTCGRRAKRRMAQSPGPNFGRFFFTCSVRNSSGTNKGCQYFKWESNLGPDTISSNLLKQFTPVVTQGKRTQSFTLSQRKHLGVGSVSASAKVGLRC